MTETIPNYVNVAPNENGSSFRGISFNDYRMLARTALSVTADVPKTMGIYKPDTGGCALDIFTADKCLTIQINSALKQIALLAADLDSPDGPLCVLSVSNTKADWDRLGQMARKELREHN